MIDYIKRLNFILSKKDRKKLIWLFLFSIVVAIIETVGVSVIMPFISLASDFSLIESNQYYKYVYTSFSSSSYVNFVTTFGLVIFCFYILRALLNALFIHFVLKFTFLSQSNIMNKLFENYLQIAHKEYIRKNSSTLTKNIVNESGLLVELFAATLFLFSEIFVLIFVYAILLYINYQIILTITVFIIIASLFVIKPISKIAELKGEEREKYQTRFYEILNKSFNNIKMLKLQNKENTLNEFNIVNQNFTNAVRVNATIQHFPRLFFDFIGFSTVIFIVIYLLYKYNTDVSNYYDVISVYILGLYRLLPSITRITRNYHIIVFQYKSLSLIYDDYNLKVENLSSDKVNLIEKIELKDISFSYDDKEKSIKNLNLIIKKNSKVAFVGESGSGKSTLVDIIMGIHLVSSGKVLVDGIELNYKNINDWRNHFGYIPQNVYLFDGTVAENVSFGLKANENEIIQVLKKANVWEFLKSKNGLLTNVGESGVMLSGGQKQRIAIARALYKNPDILVLDEATSALDTDTEEQIMSEIYALSKDKTLIIIAHRLSTIKDCDIVYELSNGKML